MPPVNWERFTALPGSATTNFENLCRALVRRNYGEYGDFAALALQPGVEFHLKIHAKCNLGEPGRWYGWQCRWYGIPSGRALGSARKTKIELAITKTEKVLPNLTDWVLWTRYPLVKGDQEWFDTLKAKTQMHLHQWVSSEVEELLCGDTEILRSTYFGDLVVFPATLNSLHAASVAPIKHRWLPEVHQITDCERGLLRILGNAESWGELSNVSEKLRDTAGMVLNDSKTLKGTLADRARETAKCGLAYAVELSATLSSLANGQIDLLPEKLANRPPMPGPHLLSLPRHLRARRHVASLTVTNTIADIRSASALLDAVVTSLRKKIIAVLAPAGSGKTFLAAQITAEAGKRPAGVLLHGRDLHSAHNLDDLAHKVVVSTTPVASMERLLAAIDAAGQRSHCRLPIVIDGLNEAEDPRAWKPLLASLSAVLQRYPFVFFVCTLRTDFSQEAVPQDVECITMPGFGEDRYDAILKYFRHYRINFQDAELPIGLLAHPLTLRLFCEVTNPTREHIVGVEAMPGSLSAILERYLEKAGERIEELSPHALRYFRQDVRDALYKIGELLWNEKQRSLDLAALRVTLGDQQRPWDKSIVRALEQEGILIKVPGEPSSGPRVAGVYDQLGGHLVASAILAKYGRIGVQNWSQDPATSKALADLAPPDRHPLSTDTFQALVGLIPRKLNLQLWPMLGPPLREAALRGAADLEGSYLDSQTIQELAKLAPAKLSGSRDLFDRLWQTRSAPAHPLKADFLHMVLMGMSMADRDLRWTEWVRHNRKDLLSDVVRFDKRWREDIGQRPQSERLRARWFMWLLTSTDRELRDSTTKALLSFGFGDPEGLFLLTLESLYINDPYVPERMLAASYGLSMTLDSLNDFNRFRNILLPWLARNVFQMMFAEGAPFSTTHTLRRDYAKGIIDLTLHKHHDLLTPGQKKRISPPFAGGIQNWRYRPDYDAGKYREGNDPLGMDWENYTMGNLARGRSTYDFSHPDFAQVKEQILWRIHDLGYSLARFGEIDKDLARRRWSYGEDSGSNPDRYGKKYSWIAFYELSGFRHDHGMIERKPWRESEPHPDEIDIDPSFPNEPVAQRIIKEDLLGTKHRNARLWVNKGPVPAFSRYFFQQTLSGENGPWIMAHIGHFRHGKEIRRTGFVRIRAFFVRSADLTKLKKLLRSSNVEFEIARDTQDVSGFFGGESSWRNDIPYAFAESIRHVIGKQKISQPTFTFAVQMGDKTIRVGPGPSWGYQPIYESIDAVPLAQHNGFSARTTLKRPGGLVPSRQLCEYSDLRLSLPAWNTRDSSGRLASIATGVPGLGNSESALFLRADILRKYMAHTRARLIWMVSGERQRLTDSGMNAAYQQYDQVFLWEGNRVKKLYGKDRPDRSATRRRSSRRAAAST
jgi:hypothetical protein